MLADAMGIARVQVESWRVAYQGLIPEVELEALDTARGEELWRQRITEGSGILLVACEFEKVLGFCSAVPRDGGVEMLATFEITTLYVAPQHWRQGIGRRLCSEVLKHIAQKGGESVILWTLFSNAPARRFYEALGFRDDGARRTETMRDESSVLEMRYRLAISEFHAD